uniref:Uncharacterized protein n=1 Tax=Arundo donax TaxID=35708 RepID=A0A0A9HR77_ARUDO
MGAQKVSFQAGERHAMVRAAQPLAFGFGSGWWEEACVPAVDSNSGGVLVDFGISRLDWWGIRCYSLV